MRSLTAVLRAAAAAFRHRPLSLVRSRVACGWTEYQRVSVVAHSTIPSSNAASRNFETLRSTGLKQDHKKASLVIFDKDGTLICFHTMWSPWAQKLISNITTATGLNISDKLSHTLGYCAKSKRIYPGLLAESTTPIIQEQLVKLLVAEGIKEEEASEIIRQSWFEGDTGNPDSIKSVANLQTLFHILKDNGVKVAICTADNRRGTLNTLRNLNLFKYVDMVVCGDDPGTEPKPSPHNALMICEQLGVSPADTVMVGDTKADVGMGHAAKLGWTVGVLSGVGDSDELKPEADHIISSVSDLLPLILPFKEWREHYAFSTEERILVRRVEEEEVVSGEAVKVENVELVVLDLHGTILCLQSKYADWLAHLADRMEKTTGLKLADKIYTAFGACKETNKVKVGLLATSTHARLRSELVKILREAGTFYEEAIVTVNQVWNDCSQTLMEATPRVIDPNFFKDPEDLPFSKGDILELISKDEDEWWTARDKHGRVGQIPVKYTTRMQESNGASSNSNMNEKPAYSKPENILPQPVKEMQLPAYARVVTDRNPNAYDRTQLRLRTGEIVKVLATNVNGQWEGEVNGRRGIFPFTHVQFISEEEVP